jgi:protocatechuate 3,4-dioxygenase beta subunit
MRHQATGISPALRGVANLPWAAVALAAVALVGCNDSTSPAKPVVAALKVAVADSEAGTVGTVLTTPLSVRAVDASGNPVPGASVTFSVSRDGSVSPATAVADDSGLATTTLTIATVAEQIVVTATDSAVTPVTIIVTAMPAAPAALAKVSGDSQTVAAGTPAPAPLVVQVTDQYGNPVPGVTVTWATSGAGVLGSASTQTDATGSAQNTFTLDPAAGAQTVTVSVTGLASLTFTETGT